MQVMITLNSQYRELFEQVEVKPLGDLYDLVKDRILFKECYNNSFRCIEALKGFGYNVQYVVGVAESIIPIDHSWICVDGVYYDPTWEIHSEIRENYYVVAKLDISDLVKVITNNNMCPPSSYELLSMHTEFVQNADEVKEFMEGLPDINSGFCI